MSFSVSMCANAVHSMDEDALCCRVGPNFCVLVTFYYWEERPLKRPEAFYIGWILRQVLARWVFVDLVWVRFIWIETHANARVIIS